MKRRRREARTRIEAQTELKKRGKGVGLVMCV